ncbi:MAG: TlpA family protein disulfide reductase [Actinomycetota bacterium]
MITRVAVAGVVVAIVVAVAWWMERRRRRDVPSQGAPVVPAQLDRADFPEPSTAWLVVLFTSQACASCAGLPEKALPLAGPEVAVTEVGYPARRELQERYGITAVPLTVVADADGVVRASFIGTFTATDLWGALADLRG